MNKTELIKKVAEKTEATQVDTAKIVNAALDVITEALVADEKVQLIGFGTFETHKRAARAGRNPATGAKIKIKASKSAAFKAGKTLKTELNAKPAKKTTKKAAAKK